MEISKVDQDTVQNVVTVFFIHWNKRTQTQQSDVLSDLEAFLKIYKETDRFKTTFDKIRKNPVSFFVESNPDFFNQKELVHLDKEFTLAELDFIFYRDTSFMNKLKTSYKASYRKVYKWDRKITLNQIINIMAFIRGYMYSKMVELCNEKQVQYPSYANIFNQINADPYAAEHQRDL